MKRKIKKILRFFLVFLSSLALCCFCLPTEAKAQEYDGNDYTYVTQAVETQKLWAAWIYQQLESSGYQITSKISEWSTAVKDKALEFGVDVYNATGEFIDDGSNYINNVTGLVIDYTNPYVLEFVQSAENWEITDKAADTWDFYYDLYKHLYTFSDSLTIDSYFENPNAFSASGRENINKYFSFKNFGLSRGNYDDVPSSEISFDHWANSQEITFKWFRPEYFLSYNNPSSGGWVPYSGLSFDSYLSSESFDYSNQPYGLTGFGFYENGLFTTSMEYSEVGFYITDCRFDIVISNNYGGGAVAVYSSSFGGTPIVPVSNCHLVDDYILVPDDVNNSEMRFYVHQNNIFNCDVKIYTENFYFGGVTAPDQPIYSMPDPSDPNYETEKKNYDYFVTETDRLLDEYDINHFMSDIRNTFDDTPWLFYPIEFYNQVATVLTDNYSDTFDFTLEEMNFSSIADGFVIPHKEFHFDPDNLPNTVKSLFMLFQWVLTFSYFWALINWGRSLILRFGSDSTHIDYEDN